FTDEEVELAHTLKADGLMWAPAVGHFVWDREHLIKHASPFGGRTYFILEMKHFLRRSRSLEHLTESMVWLPTWPQVREQLRIRGVSGDVIAKQLADHRAIEEGCERLELYRLLHQMIRQR
ncbi:MAG: hypothetical protein AAF745_11350, partial [Planctomycetota bacterium]